MNFPLLSSVLCIAGASARFPTFPNEIKVEKGNDVEKANGEVVLDLFSYRAARTHAIPNDPPERCKPPLYLPAKGFQFTKDDDDEDGS